jgi:hypothetical protein
VNGHADTGTNNITLTQIESFDDATVTFKVWFMVFNATFNNISAMSWRTVLLEGNTGENH